jgi:hypothetical protein
MKTLVKGTLIALALAVGGMVIQASSHREAPGITKTPKLDGTDFYMFRSYEAGRAGYVTLLANYYPLQDAYGGPNFFMLDEDALYEIHIDNNGDSREDVTFQFDFQRISKDIALTVGDRAVAVPLINVGPIGPGRDDTANLNVLETYKLNIVRGDRRTGRHDAITTTSGGATFKKPVDRIGDKSIRDNNATIYNQYADNHIYDIDIPGCSAGGRVFVGQRREGFVVNLGEIFDLINTNPLGPENGETNDLAAKNITTLALEVPIDCLVGADPVIGGWTTSSAAKSPASPNGAGPCPQASAGSPDSSFAKKDDCRGTDANGATPPGLFSQASRLGMPLVNEVVIGLKDKDRFNASEPEGDERFLDYVTHPTLPVIIQLLFNVPPPPVPRNDLVQVFLTGIPGLNQPASVSPAEMMRLNTSIAPVAAAGQNRLGVLGGDAAGFPNGRRPGDDIVDIELRVVEGILLSANPAAFPKFTDGAISSATIAYDVAGNISGNPAFRLYRDTFPYLNTPLSPSPKPIHP